MLLVAWSALLILEFKSLMRGEVYILVILSCDDIIEQVFGGGRF